MKKVSAVLLPGLLLLALCLLPSPHVSAHTRIYTQGGFLDSCSNIEVSDDGILTATCQPGKESASLDLNNYLQNVDGYLQWGGSGFISSCTDIDYGDYHGAPDPGVLWATCTAENGGERPSFFDLNDCVGNEDGVLAWDC